LAKIEATAKRLEMTYLLAELLKKVNPGEVDKIVMLSLGRLAPLYKNIDFGLAEKTMMRALAKANGAEAATVLGIFKKLGDLGEVAGELKQGRRNEISSLSVSDVFDRLLDIAGQTGKDSQERKIQKTAELLGQLDPLGAKYAVRIILGNLRLGFSDKTVLDALSVMIAGDKSAREKLEAAYNVRPDVGWLTTQVQSSKFKVQSFKPTPNLGIPIMPALCQRLPAAEEIVEKMREVAVEPKWDGQRIQAHAWILRKREEGRRKKALDKKIEVKLFTRSLEDVTPMFPDLVQSIISVIKIKPSSLYPLPSSFILDGEVVAIDPKTGRVLPFQTMITRKRKYGIQEKLADVPVRYMVFDILYLNGKSLMEEPFQKRRTLLEKLLDFQNTRNTRRTRESEMHLPFSEFSEIIKIAPQIITSNPVEIRRFLKQQINNGLEGIVAKRADARYIPGRTKFAWVKLKWEGAAKSGGLLDTIDCVVIGTYSGRGKRAGFGVGAFLVGILGNSEKSAKSAKISSNQIADKSDKSESDLSDLSIIRSSRSSRNSDFSEIKFQTISKIGTGLTDEQWRELKVKSEKLKVKSCPKEYDVPKELTPDIWLRPELVVEIQADNITKSPLHSAGYALRFPRLVKYRDDKRPEQATTVAEIRKLYKMQ